MTELKSWVLRDVIIRTRDSVISIKNLAPMMSEQLSLAGRQE